MSPRQQIAQIDKQIDVNRLNPGWVPGEQRERDLFRQRGIAQLERDNADAKIARSPTMRRLKKCPTCKARTLAA